MAAEGLAGRRTLVCGLAAAALLLLAAPPAGRAASTESASKLAPAAVASERLVSEEEWAGDLVDALALERALPEKPRAADLFSLLCAEQAEREVGTGGRETPIGPLFEAGTLVPQRRVPGAPLRVVLSVPATALYVLAVEGVGLQRWVIDQRPAGHLDPTPLGVIVSPAAMPLREGPHELSGYLAPGARAERVWLAAVRTPCIAPADGWHASRPLTFGAKARTLVRAFGFERRLPASGPAIEIEGEAYESVTAGGGRTNRRVAVAASRNVWATASQGPAELVWRLQLEEPAVVTLEARVLGDSPQLWSVDQRHRATVLPGGGKQVFRWAHILTLPLGAGDHELRARIPRQAGVDLLRATPRFSSDADYAAVLGELGLRVSAAEAHVTHGEALASLGSPAFIELASGFRRRIEGDAKDREVVLVDEPGPAAASERPLSPLLPSEL